MSTNTLHCPCPHTFSSGLNTTQSCFGVLSPSAMIPELNRSNELGGPSNLGRPAECHALPSQAVVPSALKTVGQPQAGSWHPKSGGYNASELPRFISIRSLRPRIPLELQIYTIQLIRPESNILGDHSDLLLSSDISRHQKDAVALVSCSLVCRAWVAQSQKQLFAWVILRNATSLDRIHRLRDLHITRHIRRISVVYTKPYYKLGEALPRIAMIAPKSLVRIDISLSVDSRFPLFPFHPSVVGLLTRLHHVQRLSLLRLRFADIAEFRRLIQCFPGLRTVCAYVEIGADRPGQYRGSRSISNPNPSLSEVINFSAQAPDNFKLPLGLWQSTLTPTMNQNPLSSLTQNNCRIPLISEDLAQFITQFAIDLAKIQSHYSVWDWKSEDYLIKECCQCKWSLDIELSYRVLIIELEGSLNIRHIGFYRTSPSLRFTFKANCLQSFSLNHITEICMIITQPFPGSHVLHSFLKPLINIYQEEISQLNTCLNLKAIKIHINTLLDPLDCIDRFFDHLIRKSIFSDIIFLVEIFKETNKMFTTYLTIDSFHLDDLQEVYQRISEEANKDSTF